MQVNISSSPRSLLVWKPAGAKQKRHNLVFSDETPHLLRMGLCHATSHEEAACVSVGCTVW